MSMAGFLRDESGAVTADWVVLSAGLVVLGIGAVGISSGGVETLSHSVADELLPDSTMANYRYFGTTYEGYIRSVSWVSRTTGQQLDLFQQLVDPAQNSDAQLLSEHQLWTGLAEDETYPDMVLAMERVALIEVALDARGLE